MFSILWGPYYWKVSVVLDIGWAPGRWQAMIETDDNLLFCAKAPMSSPIIIKLYDTMWQYSAVVVRNRNGLIWSGCWQVHKPIERWPVLPTSKPAEYPHVLIFKSRHPLWFGATSHDNHNSSLAIKENSLNILGLEHFVNGKDASEGNFCQICFWGFINDKSALV